MKSKIVRTLTLLSLVVLLLAGITYAQYVPRIAEVRIPFDFTLAQKTFPAGEYFVVRLGRDRLELRDGQHRPLASVVTYSVQSLEKSASTKLRFSTSDGGHKLIEVWFEGDLIGDELLAPKHRTSVAKHDLSHSGELGSAGNK